MRYFDAVAIRARVPWPRMLAALDAMLKDEVAAPLRAHHPIEVPGEPTASLLLMPAWRSGRRLGVKLVTVFPGNARRDERAVSAVYALFDARNGALLALFDGEEITARRTAGASAYAAKRLARADARHLVVVGSGRIARELVDAHRSVRPIERVSLWSRTPEHAQAAAANLAKYGHPVTVVRNLETAVRTADIVCCATLSTAPLVLGAWLPPGVHLDLVGAFRSHMRETDDAAIARADIVVVDNRAAALAEGGDIVQAMRNGALGEAAICADLADLARGAHPGRTRADEVTVFKSVGFALEDLAAAEAVFDGLPLESERGSRKEGAGSRADAEASAAEAEEEDEGGSGVGAESLTDEEGGTEATAAVAMGGGGGEGEKEGCCCWPHGDATPSIDDVEGSASKAPPPVADAPVDAPPPPPPPPRSSSSAAQGEIGARPE